jgi:hypothetical protein
MSLGGMPVIVDRWSIGGRALRAPALWFALVAGPCLGLAAPSAAAPDVPSNRPDGIAPSSTSAALPKMAQAATGLTPDMNCPAVEVRRGASTLSIGPTGERTAMTLKYQASFVRFARECTVADGNMLVKIGVEGRIVLGPAGSAGRVDIPLRFAVVHETPTGMRPIATKFVLVPVDLGSTGNTPFVYVEEGLTFPIPTPTTALDEYLVYVGFDPVSAEARSKPPPKAPSQEKPHGKRKPKAEAPADGK